MFKKLMSFLFEEEEIVEEVPQYKEDISKKREPSDFRKPQNETPEVTLEDPLQEKVKPKSIFVDSDDEVKPQPTYKAKEPEHVSQPIKKVEIDKNKALEYEFSSSISPIFGKMPEKQKEEMLMQPKIIFEQENSVIGTVISPIYGVRKRAKTTAKTEKTPPVNKSMSIEDILGVSDESNQNTQQLEFDNQLFENEKPVDKEKPKEEVLMQLFEEDDAQ